MQSFEVTLNLSALCCVYQGMRTGGADREEITAPSRCGSKKMAHGLAKRLRADAMNYQELFFLLSAN
jgi:hypothetical protein